MGLLSVMEAQSGATEPQGKPELNWSSINANADKLVSSVWQTISDTVSSLSRLTADQEGGVRQLISAHLALLPKALHRLAHRAENRQAVVLYPFTSDGILEALAYNAGDARTVHLPSTPRIVDLLRAHNLFCRASQRAFPQMSLLRGVIRHPNATSRAILFMSRLNCPDVASAVLAWRASRLSGSVGEYHD